MHLNGCCFHPKTLTDKNNLIRNFGVVCVDVELMPKFIEMAKEKGIKFCFIMGA